jgi:hypothetical protein
MQQKALRSGGQRDSILLIEVDYCTSIPELRAAAAETSICKGENAQARQGRSGNEQAWLMTLSSASKNPYNF